MDGHTGRSAAGGAVIESCGHFLIGGKFAVGIIVFAILVVINIIVVTKGAERIAEVGARFTRDAMPGKQMVIAAQPKLQTVEPNAQASWGDLVREAAQMAGFTVLDRSTVVATHLSHCVAHGALLADEEPAAATPALNRYPTEER